MWCIALVVLRLVTGLLVIGVVLLALVVVIGVARILAVFWLVATIWVCHRECAPRSRGYSGSGLNVVCEAELTRQIERKTNKARFAWHISQRNGRRIPSN